MPEQTETQVTEPTPECSPVEDKVEPLHVIPNPPAPEKPVYSLKLRKCFGNLRYRQCISPVWLRSDFLAWAMKNGYHDGMHIAKRDKNLVHSPTNSYFVLAPTTKIS